MQQLALTANSGPATTQGTWYAPLVQGLIKPLGAGDISSLWSRTNRLILEQITLGIENWGDIGIHPIVISIAGAIFDQSHPALFGLEV